MSACDAFRPIIVHLSARACVDMQEYFQPCNPHSKLSPPDEGDSSSGAEWRVYRHTWHDCQFVSLDSCCSPFNLAVHPLQKINFLASGAANRPIINVCP
jgi:hypothetical protein